MSIAPEPSTHRDTDTTSTGDLQIQAAELRADGTPVKEIARQLSVSERTLYRWFKTAN